MKKIILVILAIVLLSACKETIEPVEPISTNIPIATNNPNSNKEGESNVEKVLLTKEEFVQLLEKYDLGVTIKDFDGLDIDDFILKYEVTQEFLDEVISDNSTISWFLGRYIEDMPEWEQQKKINPYLVRALKYADSVDEEYEEFIDRYFKALQIEAEFMYKDEDGVNIYMIRKNGERLFWGFCQTSKSEKLVLPDINLRLNETYKIELKDGTDEIHSADIYYSKNNKYLMYLDGEIGSDFDEYLNLVKTFCELED